MLLLLSMLNHKVAQQERRFFLTRLTQFLEEHIHVRTPPIVIVLQVPFLCLLINPMLKVSSVLCDVAITSYVIFILHVKLQAYVRVNPTWPV